MNSVWNESALAGKNALVVCPENGWGKEIVAGLKNAGAKVYLAGPNEAEMKSLTADLALAGYTVYDHRTHSQTLAMANAVVGELGSIDILVENSSQTEMRGWEQTYEQINDQLQLTHLGMMLTVQTVGNVMAKQRSGSVILMTDTAALTGYDPYNYTNAAERFDEDFSLVKGFIYGGAVNYARQAAGFLGENGCRCNALACAPRLENDGFAEGYLRHSHIKSPVTGEDVSSAVIFLASDGAARITGVTLPVDGGYTAK